MHTRRNFLTTISATSLALSLTGCTATSDSPSQSDLDDESDTPSEPYPMVAFDKQDNDTVAATLDVLDDADYVRIETDTTDQTTILKEEGDQEVFTNLNGGNITVIAVIEQDGETYEYDSGSFDASYVPPTPEQATPTDEPTVKFVEKQSDDGIIIEVQCRGLGDADYILVDSSREDDYPLQLADYGESVFFRNMESGDELTATAVTNGTESTIDTYTVE